MNTNSGTELPLINVVRQHFQNLKETLDSEKDEIISQIVEANKKQMHPKRPVSDHWKQLHFMKWFKVNHSTISPSSFQNIQLVGKGCNSHVMKCEIPCEINYKQENFKVTLKMVLNFGDSNNFSFSDLRESETSLQSHPNIVRMLGKFIGKPTMEMIGFVDDSIRDLFYESNNTLKDAQFYIYPFYEKNLEYVVKNENLNSRIIFNYGVQIARILLHLYENKIAHLNLKLTNFMISDTNEIVLNNFSCASKLDDLYETKENHMGGNMAHLSPEVLRSMRERTKLPCEAQYSWELGILLSEMLSDCDFHFIESAIQSEGIINVDSFPNEFHYLLKNLLCPQDQRMHIIDAWKYLENSVNNSS